MRNFGQLVLVAVATLAMTGVANAGTTAVVPAPPGFAQASAKAGSLHGDAVAFSNSPIVIPLLAEQDQTFEVHGRVTPELIVPALTKLRLQLANNTTLGAYGVDVTRTPPPYANKRQDIPATPPRNVGSVPGLIAASGLVPARSKGSKALMMGSTGWFQLPPGTYHYVCTTTGNAGCGIHGTIEARAG